MPLALLVILFAQNARAQSVLIYEWKGRTFSPLGATFTPDGRYVLLSGEWTGDAGGTQPELRVWDVDQGEFVGEHRIGGRGRIEGLDVAPDGKILLAATWGPGRRVKHDGQTEQTGPNDVWLWRWEMRSRKPRSDPQSVLAPMHRILAATWTTWDSSTNIWGHVLFSPQGNRIAVNRHVTDPDQRSARHTYSEIDILEPSGQLITTIVPPAAGTSGTAGMTFSPDGRTLATSTLKAAAPNSPESVVVVDLRLWDVEDAEEIAHNSVSDSMPRQSGRHFSGGRECVAYSHNGSLIASDGADFAVQIWNAKTLTREMELFGLDEKVSSLAFSPDGRFVAAASSWKIGRGRFLVWDAKSGKMRWRLAEDQPVVRDVEFSPNGRLLLTQGEAPGGGGQVRLWDVEQLLAN